MITTASAAVNATGANKSVCLGQTLGKADFARRPMSLRKFLEPFDHSVLTDYEAGAKYAAYKTSFAKQQLEDFFEKNKSQAWFREKYHPDARPDANLRQRLCERRLEVFMELYRSGSLDKLKLSCDNEITLLKLLDFVAVKLAGGTDEDVSYLDEFDFAELRRKVRAPVSSIGRKVVASSDVPVSQLSSTAQIEPTKKETLKRKTLKHPKGKSQVMVNSGQTANDNRRGRNKLKSRSLSGSSSGSSGSSSSASRSGSGSSSSSRNSRATSGSSESGSSSSSDSSGSSSSSSDEGTGSSASESQSDAEHSQRRRRRMSSKNVKVSDKGAPRGRGNGSGASSDRSSNPSDVLNSENEETSKGQSGKIPWTKNNSSETLNCDPQRTEQADETHNHISQQDHQVEMTEELESEPVRRLPIHCTRVLYFSHIPLSIYQKDIIALLSTSPYFLRLAVLDPFILPSSDNRDGHGNEPFFSSDTNSPSPGIALRRVGWATFSAQALESGNLINVDVESICAKLLRDAVEAQAPESLLECLRSSRVLPDDFRRPNAERIRSTSHFLMKLMDQYPSRLYSKVLLRRHLVLAARLTEELDAARGLWRTTKSGDKNEFGAKRSLNQMDQSEDSPNKRTLTQRDHTKIDPGDDLLEAATILGNVDSDNPLLYGLTDYLVDEGNAEEELLLTGGFQTLSFNSAPVAKGSTVMTSLPVHSPELDDTEMLHVLDRIILYLRVVHSVDFYAPAMYPNEDAMPHPCLLIHVRPAKTDIQKALSRLTSQGPLGAQPDYDAVFSSQLKRLVRLVRPLEEADCKKLGLRDVDEVVDNFIKANTRRKRRKTDVIWVCLLSDKKFRDPIYVKKHIMNKHVDKVELVKKDSAVFFNNYLLDPMRPQLPLEPHLPAKKRRSVSLSDHGSRAPVNVADNGGKRDRSADHDDTRWFRPHPRNEFDNRQMFPRTQRDYPIFSGFPRPYGRMQYFPPRLPFQNYRARVFGTAANYGGVRRGFPRRPYIDLDAP